MIKAAVLLLASVAAFGEQPNLMPWPAKMSTEQGSLAIDQSFRVALSGYQDPRLRAAAERFIGRMALQTGMPLNPAIVQEGAPATLSIECGHAGEMVQKLGEDESYRLEVSEKHVTLKAANPLGILRGLETFRQLVEISPHGFTAPLTVIADAPRFPWRGLHLDVSRHWMPVEVVKRNLDGMAAVKLNVFHWHLSDDQGFRIESKVFPKLQELGSDGNYYTQDQAREVIAYARDRGIRVVPEFDMPGHTTSWFVGYPELASAPGPYEIGRVWDGYEATMDPSRESTYQFLDAFIGEMAALFPDQFFHIGGDEVNPKQWNANAGIQAFMREHGFKDPHDLQAYFNRRVQAIVAKHGKRMEGWDEILDPDLPKDIVIQSWRGRKSLADAARLGYSGLLSTGYYLDHMEPASKLYMVDPLEAESAALTPQEKARILGGEVAMWAEFVSAENVDSRIWPRAAAVAERLWSPQEIKDIASMYRRLEVVSRNLNWLGLTHQSSYDRMLGRLAGTASTAPLKELADVVEPATLGQRARTNQYTQQTPLNRLVDAARPESATAREFAALVDRMDQAALREWLDRWRDNDTKLAPILAKSFLLEEDAPVSKDLSRMASIGIEALDYIHRHRRPTRKWLSEQRAFLDQAGKLQAELRIAVTPSIRKLVDAAGGR